MLNAKIFTSWVMLNDAAAKHHRPPRINDTTATLKENIQRLLLQFFSPCSFNSCARECECEKWSRVGQWTNMVALSFFSKLNLPPWLEHWSCRRWRPLSHLPRLRWAAEKKTIPLEFRYGISSVGRCWKQDSPVQRVFLSYRCNDKNMFI